MSWWMYAGNRAEDYQLPYYQYVSHDPSMDDMRKVVCTDNIRPSIASWWKSDEVYIIDTEDNVSLEKKLML